MGRLGALAHQVARSVVGLRGSTRSAALLRVFSAMILWDRHTKTNLLYLSLDDPLHTAFAAVFFVGPALMILGLFSRLATWVTTLAVVGWSGYVVYVLHQHRPIEAFVLYPLVGVCFTDCGGSYSLDRVLAVRRARREGRPPPPERGSVWGLRLVALHISTLYFFAAVDKSDLAWLQGERMERFFLRYYWTSDYPSFWGFHPAMVALAIFTVVLEYLLSFGLWFRLGRRWLLAPAVLMNLGFYSLLPAGQIVWHAWLCYLAFFPPDEFHELLS